MQSGEFMVVALGFLPVIGFLATNWLQLNQLLLRDTSNRKAINKIGKRVIRIEDHLISTDDFSRDTDSFNLVDDD